MISFGFSSIAVDATIDCRVVGSGVVLAQRETKPQVLDERHVDGRGWRVSFLLLKAQRWWWWRRRRWRW